MALSSKVTIITAIFTLLGQNIVFCENILFYGIVGSYSQRISMWPLMEALADKGHNVTFISAYDSTEPHPNPRIRDYTPTKWKQAMGPWEEHMNFFNIRKNKQLDKMWLNIPDVGILACESLYLDSEFLDWLRSSQFDLIIVDTLMNECAYGMVHFFQAKLILYATSKPMQWFTDSLGLPDETSSISELSFNFPPGNQMTFAQRFYNAINPIAWKFLREYWYLPKLEEITRQGLRQLQSGTNKLPPFTQIEKNTSLVMITTHYTLDHPRSFPPYVVPVGGIVTFGKKEKPLPPLLQRLIEEREGGFIFISFGTVAEFTNFDETVRKEFIKAVAKFPEILFVWKSSYKIEDLLPNNVYVAKWAPQQTLLAHPKIKAFISHMGMGSSAEAIHYAVPLIAMPVLAEQDSNCDFIMTRGVGVKLEITKLTDFQLENAIYEITHNPIYRLKMKKLSEIFKDRQTTVLENAVWWTEFTLRHENIHEYWRPPSVQLEWWKKRQIDVWLFAVVLALVIVSFPLLIAYKIMRILQKWIYKKAKVE